MSEVPASEVAARAVEEAPRKTGSFLGKVLVGGFLVGVVTVECLTVYLFLPGEAETAALAGIPPSGATEEVGRLPPLSEEVLTPQKAVPQVEVDLGEFTITSYQPLSNTTLRIDFHLYGTVATEHQPAFQEALQANIHRFRDQVIVIVRSADLTDLTDPGLGLIKRKILEKTNALLGKRYLKAVILSDFSFIEQ